MSVDFKESPNRESAVFFCTDPVRDADAGLSNSQILEELFGEDEKESDAQHDTQSTSDIYDDFDRGQDVSRAGTSSSCYSDSKDDIIATTNGDAVQPPTYYQEEIFFTSPVATGSVRRGVLLDIADFASQALHHVRRTEHYINLYRQSAESVQSDSARRESFDSELITEGSEDEFDPLDYKRSIFLHWNCLLEILDRLEDKDGWDVVYEFCQQKSQVCLDHILRINADDVGHAYSNLHSLSQPLILQLKMMAVLIPQLDIDLDWIISTIEDMAAGITNFGSALERNNSDTTTTSSQSSRLPTSTAPTSSMTGTPCIYDDTEDESGEKETLHNSPIPTATVSHHVVLARTGPSLEIAPMQTTRGRLTRSHWKAIRPTALDRVSDDVHFPYYQSIFRECTEVPPSHIDMSVAKGQSGIIAGLQVRGSYPGGYRTVAAPRKTLSERLSNVHESDPLVEQCIEAMDIAPRSPQKRPEFKRSKTREILGSVRIWKRRSSEF